MIDSKAASKREKFFYHNNLVTLVKSIENKYTTVDLRNECTVTGRVVSVDGYMNLELTNACYYDQRGQEHYFDNFFVQNRNVRYIHMPQGTTCANLLEQQIYTLENPTWFKEKKKRTFKEIRAKRYNDALKQEIATSYNK